MHEPTGDIWCRIHILREKVEMSILRCDQCTGRALSQATNITLKPPKPTTVVKHARGFLLHNSHPNLQNCPWKMVKEVDSHICQH